jgi:hypothetical protein
MPHWKPSCFLINDASQKLRALRLVLYLVPTLYIFPWMFFCIFHKNFDYLKKILDYFKWILCYIDPIHSWWFYCICFPIRVVWGMDKLPIFLCCWPLLKAWFVCGIKKNQRCGGARCSPPRLSWCDVHFHQSWKNNWWFQRAWEHCYERKPSQT